MKNLKLKTVLLALSLGMGLSASAVADIDHDACNSANYACQYLFDFNACIYVFQNCG
ncbi:MAG: hypothetical protein MJK04_13460 [Psychrosphaera sp.]|nr:hypothetical protein [Psychrosphaera sp.]